MAIGAFALASITLAGCSATEETQADGTVTVLTAYSTIQVASIQAELDSWSESSGIKVIVTTSTDISTDLKAKIIIGEEPDLAIIPSPLNVTDLADSGSLVSLDDAQGFDLTKAQETLVPGWEPVLTASDNKIYGVPVRAYINSMVFYNPVAFAKNNYKTPTTEAELYALIDQIKKDESGYPWCAGIEAGGGTGLPFADWVEKHFTDLYGTDDYYRWIEGEISFDSEQVAKAVDRVTEVMLADGNVDGGRTAMVTDGYGNIAPLFLDGGKAEGQCLMSRERQSVAGLITDPEVKNELLTFNNVTLNVFPYPETTGGVGNSVTGAFDSLSILKGHTDSDVMAVAQYMASSDFGSQFVSGGWFLSPHKDFDTSLYPGEMWKNFGTAVADADFFAFDAISLLPVEVRYEFLDSGTQFVGGTIDWDTAAKTIDSKY